MFILRPIPALKRRAIVGRPSGTKSNIPTYNPVHAARDPLRGSLGPDPQSRIRRALHAAGTQLDRFRQRLRTRPALPRPRIALRPAALLEIRRIPPPSPGRSRDAPLLG